MRVGLTARLSNGPMLEYRQRFGLSKKAAADLAGVNQSTWGSFENLRFSGWIGKKSAQKIADAIGVEVEEILPEELRGADLRMERTAFRDVDPQKILEAVEAPDHCLPDLTAETRELVRKAIGQLEPRKAQAVVLRFGLEDERSRTYREIGEVLDVCSARAKQITDNAIRDIRGSIKENDDE